MTPQELKIIDHKLLPPKRVTLLLQGGEELVAIMAASRISASRNAPRPAIRSQQIGNRQSAIGNP